MNTEVHKKLLIVLTALMVGGWSPVQSLAQDHPTEDENVIELKINPEYVDARFDGIGAVSAGASSRLLIDYPEPIRSKLLDYLFKPQYGASFDHLKVEIGGDVNSTDGTEPSHMRKRGEANYTRGYEWWLMREAKKRNPDIKLDALPWGAPGWIDDGNFYSQDAADYVASFAEGAKEQDIPLDYIGILNEYDLQVPYIKRLRKTLDEKGLQDVKIVANDAHASMDFWKIADSMRVDPELREAVYAIGVHYPRKETTENALQLQDEGVNLWSSEDHYANGVTINDNFVERHLTKTEFWSPITSYYDALTAPNSGLIHANTPWSGAFEVLPRLWAVAHTTQFTEPGWFYIENGNQELPGGGTIVSLTSPNHQELSLIAETREASSSQELKVKLPSRFNGKKLHVWHSDRLQQFIPQDDIEVEEGSFTITLEPNSNYSITTTTGQRKGDFTSPRPKAFPLPYKDNFESYKAHQTPKYLSDMYGAFEVEVGDDGQHYLRQQIDQKGILWLGRLPESKAHTAFTVIGNENWNDVEVSVDARLEVLPDQKGVSADRYVSVITRYYPKNFDNFVEPYPIGYTFRLYADGKWDITTGEKVIAEGKTDPPGSEWHRITLRNRGESLTALVDGEEVSQISDPTYRQGLVGFGSDLKPARFDNFEIRDIHE